MSELYTFKEQVLIGELERMIDNGNTAQFIVQALKDCVFEYMEEWAEGITESKGGE